MKRWLTAVCLSVLAAMLACVSLPTGEAPTSTATSAITPTVHTATPSFPGWLTYANASCGFEIQYPPTGTLTASDAFHARIDLPMVPGTNLSEKYARIDVEASADPCLSPLALGYDLSALNTSTVTVNGVSYLRQEGSDAGAGNFYEWVAYSTSADCGCVSLSFVLHSLNAMNFPTPPPLFDPVAESAIFDDILSTLTWQP
jgi:hypothetical protein